MTEPPRRLPPTPEERLKVNLQKMAPGADLGATRTAQPIAGAGAASMRSIAPSAAPSGSPVTVGDTTGFTNAVAITATTGNGAGSTATASDAVAIGDAADAAGGSSISVGRDSGALDDYAVAVGYFSKAAASAVSIGSGAGLGTGKTQDSAVCIGPGVYSQSARGIAIGDGARVVDATHDNISGIAIGTSAQVSESNSGIAIGDSSSAAGNYAMAIGGSAVASVIHALAVGQSAHATGTSSTAVGENADASGIDAVALGHAAQADADYALCIAAGFATGAGSAAIGTDHTGSYASASGTDEFVIGTNLHNVSIPGKFGVHGAAPVAQAAAPTTLADVITILRNHGFCA
jgi:hypothetical protein